MGIITSHLKPKNGNSGYEYHNIMYLILKKKNSFLFYLFKWGEGFYRRDGNETPNSSDPEVAELQEMFAVVKRKHQANHRQWRKDFAGYLMQLEATNMEPPKFTEEYRQFFRRYDIPFVTEKYQNWVRLKIKISIVILF